MNNELEFKIATEDWEFEQINDLNYRTFVEEIPQHKKNEDRSLLDRFHSENTYLICLRDKKLLGMMAVRDKRPFSLDSKLEDLSSYLPEHEFACEFRLLSIEKEVRNKRIIQGLMVLLARYADEKGYDIALISANVKRLKFYKQIGFNEFGPEVGSKEARYQPMYLTLESSRQFRRKSKLLTRLPENFSINNREPLNLLPGPVSVDDLVKKAMSDPSVSHRSEEFKNDFHSLKAQLCNLTGAKNVQILMGSGTLANDAVAAQLSCEKGKGLILSNGEFGDRLIDHAERALLNYDVFSMPWGNSFDYDKIEALVLNAPEISWIWAVHCETSTGVLNDIDFLNNICQVNGASLCLDCVSSLGMTPFDLSSVYLATAVSGKGLASYSGLSFVFCNQQIKPSSEIPRYLDLGFYTEAGGIPFTMSSNLVYALSRSLEFVNEKRYKDVRAFSSWIKENLNLLNFDIIADDQKSCPGIITISLPDWISSSEVGNTMQHKGILLHWRSPYLLKRNWIQIALMGKYSKAQIQPLFKYLSELKKPLSKAL